MLPHVVGNLVAGPGRGHDGLGIQFTDTPGRKDGGVQVVRREELEEAPDADAAAKLAFGELHGWLVTGTPQEHSVEVHGQIHGQADAWRVGKVLKVYVPRAITLGSGTKFLEFLLHGAGHLDLSGWRRCRTAAANGQTSAGHREEQPLARVQWQLASRSI
jgi:hypothetical protein